MVPFRVKIPTLMVLVKKISVQLGNDRDIVMFYVDNSLLQVVL